MSDDIDIEEHDLLQHPALRSVFPDLACVKHEVVEISDEHSGNGPPKANANDQQKITTAPNMCEQLHPKDNPSVQQKSPKNNSEDVQIDNEKTKTSDGFMKGDLFTTSSGLAQPHEPHRVLKLHPKDIPSVPQQSPKNNSEDIQIDNEKTKTSNGSMNVDLFTKSSGLGQPHEPHRVLKYATRKISKIKKRGDIIKENKTDTLQSQSKNYRTLNLTKTGPEKRCFHTVVALPDWGPLLKKNKLYCSECQILFAAKSAIDLHNHQKHKPGKKFKGQVQNQNPERNLIHTEKAVKNDHIPATIPIETPMPEHKCQFCNAISATKDGLIEHLYEHATAGIHHEPPTHKCDFCEAKFTCKTFLENHLWNHARSRISSITNTDILTKNQNSKAPRVTRLVRIYKCTACDLHFLNKNTLVQHLMYNHTVDKSKIVRCETCHLTFKPPSLFKHKEIHHKQNNYCIDNFKIVQLSPETSKASLKKKGYQTWKITHSASTGNTSSLKNKMTRKVLKRIVPATDMESESSSTGTSAKPVASKNKGATVNRIDTKAPLSTSQTNTRPVTLYKCTECDLHFLNENTQLQHFMYNHKVDKSKIFRCQTCNLGFRPLSLAKHNESHHKQNNYGIEDFNIMALSPKNYKASFTKKGYQIANKRHGKSVGYKIHAHSQISSRVNTDISKNNRIKKMLTKVVPAMEFESARDSIKTTAQRIVSKNESTVNCMDVQNPMVTSQVSARPVTLYKCTACDLHCLTENTLLKHLGYKHKVDKTDIVRCENCNLTFKPYSLKRHNKNHHTENHYGIKDFNIVELNPENYKAYLWEKGYKTAKKINNESIGQGIHAHSQISSGGNTDISKNYRIKKALTRVVPTTDIESETDSIKTSAEPIVSENESATVNCMDIQNPMVTPQIDARPVTLYKCTACDLHCLTENTLLKHLGYKHKVNKRKIVRCETCGLTFTAYSLNRHNKNHHIQNNFGIDDLNIVELSPQNYKAYLWEKEYKTAKIIREESIGQEIHTHSLISSRANSDISEDEDGKSSNQNHASESNESLKALASGDTPQVLAENYIIQNHASALNESLKVLSSGALSQVLPGNDIIQNHASKSNESLKVLASGDASQVLAENYIIQNHASALNESLKVLSSGAPSQVLPGNDIIQNHASALNESLKVLSSGAPSQVLPGNDIIPNHASKSNESLKVLASGDASQVLAENYIIQNHASALNEYLKVLSSGAPSQVLPGNDIIQNHASESNESLKVLSSGAPSQVLPENDKIQNHAFGSSESLKALALGALSQVLPENYINCKDSTTRNLKRSITTAIANPLPITPNTNCYETSSSFENKITLYKCTACDLHCLTENTLLRHVGYKHKVDKRKIVRCETCGLTFKPYSLKRHSKNHHIQNNYGIQDFNIVELSPENYKAYLWDKGYESAKKIHEESIGQRVDVLSLISSRANSDISEDGNSSNQNHASASSEILKVLASEALSKLLPENDIISKDSTPRNLKRSFTTANANPAPITPNTNCFGTTYSYKKHKSDEHALGDQVPLECLPCRSSFTSVVDHNLHLRRLHVIYSCGTCHSQLRGSIKFSVHRRWCNAKESKLSDGAVTVMSKYRCKLCNLTFQSVKSCRLHRLTHRPNTSLGLSRKSRLQLLNKSQVSDETEPRVIHTLSRSPVLTDKSAAPLEPIKTSIQRAVGYRRAVALDLVLRCSKCQLNIPASKNMPLGSDHNCSNNLPFGYCDLCQLKFLKRDLPLHFDVHNPCKEIRVMEYKEYSQRGQILHKCEQCGLCCRTLSSLTWHYCNTSKSRNCNKCGRDIDNGSNMYAIHRKDHTKLAVTGKDFIVILYRLIKIINLTPKIKKPRKRGIRTVVRWSRKSNSQGRHMKIIRCDRCKSHMTDSQQVVLNHKNLEDCKGQCTICKYCGLSFIYASSAPHLKAHERSPKRLHAWDFEVETVTGEGAHFDLQDALALLPQCKRCGVIFNSFQSVCRRWNCRDVKTKKCRHCDATFTSGAYVWHFVLHDTQQSPTIPQRRLFEPKVSTENKVGVYKLNLTLLRCTKCKLHLPMNGIGRHNSKNCFLAKMSVCQLCGLTFSRQSITLHHRMHRRSRVPLTMTSFTILSTNDLQLVGPEPCPFPACVRCGIIYEGTNGTHQKYANCKNDRIPRLRCPTCHLTFTSGAYPLHLGYYGCSGTPILLSELPKPKKKRAIELPNSYKLSATHEPWTQLYRCRECDVAVDSYEEVVSHIERHCSQTVSPCFLCHACDMKFESACFSRHEELHRSRPGLDGSNFEVLEYRPADYGTKRWIPYQNGFTGRRLKYNLKQAGLAQITLYECAHCEKYCSSRVAAYQHTMWEWNCRAPSIRCATCSLPFERQSLASHVAVHSRIPHFAADAFRVFRFLRRVNCPAETSRDSGPTLYKCPKCNIYHLTTRQAKKHFLEGHSGLKRTKLCHVCNYQFTSKVWTQHQLLHHELNDYRRSDFTIRSVYRTFTPTKLTTKTKMNRMVIGKVAPAVDIKNEIDPVETENVIPMNEAATADDIDIDIKTTIVSSHTNTRPVTLYKCTACNLHFLTENTLVQHLMYNHTVDKSRIVSCQSCHLTFKTHSLINHNEKHHKQNDYGIEDFNIVELSPENFKERLKKVNTVKKKNKKSIRYEIGTNSLFRCTLCRVHYLSIESLRRHFSDHKILNSQEICSCSHCGLGFTGRTLSSHVRIHHQQNQYKAKDFEIYDSRP